MLLRSRLILVFLCLSGAVCSSVYAVNPTATDRTVTVEADNSAVRLEYDFARMSKSSTVVDGVERTLHVVPDEGTTYDHGKPVLPAISRWVVVPPTAGVELVVTADPPRRVPADSKPLLNSEGDSTAVSTLSGSDGIYPNVIAAMGEPIILRGVRLVLVTTYPVRYDANTNSYLYYDRIRTELRFTEGEPVNPAELPVRRNRSPHFLNTLENLAINPENIGRDDPDHPQEYVGHYLVVIHESLLPFVSPFVEWRRKSGWKVDIYSVPAADAMTPATIKADIQARYDTYKNAGVDPFDHIMLIGDRSDYHGYSDPVGFVLEAEQGSTQWGGAPHADYKYGLLEGNDDIPDIAISRWAAGSKSLMDLNIGKTLGYEATPRMENPEWFTTGGVMSTHAGNGEFTSWHITENTTLRWGTEVLEKMGFTKIVSYEDYSWDSNSQRLGPVYKDLLNNGSNLLLTFSRLYYFRNSAMGINNNTVHPIDIANLGRGLYSAWWLTRTGSGANLKGPVAKTFSWDVDGSYTSPASLIWLTMVRGVVMNEITLGWGRTFAIANLASFYGNNLNIVSTRTDFDVAGDPAIQPWLGVPQVVTATFSDEITPNTNSVEIKVTDQEAGTPVAGAQVTVYVPENIPAFDSPDYATYDDMKMWTMTSGEDGVARFVFPDDNEFVRFSDIFVTVTGRKIRPFFWQSFIDFHTAPEISSYLLEESDGNGDEELNPGETFAITITAVNSGEVGQINGVGGNVRSLSPYIAVEENEINFGDIPAGEEAVGDAPVLLTVSQKCPDSRSRPATKPKILVEFTREDQSWSSLIEINVGSPNVEVKTVVGGNIIPQDGEEYELDIELTNTGSIATAESFTGSIRPVTNGTVVINRQSRYDRIAVGASGTVAGEKFVLKASEDVPPGFVAGMVLVLRTEEGFQDSAFFQLQIGTTGENKPSLPDKYGYSVYDDTDAGFDETPIYNWIEISDKEQNRNYDGVSCEFDGIPDDPYGYNTGQTKVVPIGFKTQFYGYEYDTLSICSNGFISMGNQPHITNYQNWPMEQAIGGGVGMVAPFWDKLRLDPGIGNVYYFYDEDSARFIVEWYNLRHYTNPQVDLIFQVVLYASEAKEWGDAPLLVQYKSISNAMNVGGGGASMSGDQKWITDNPYASVGISSPDGNTGVNYCFANVYPTSSALLQNGRVLKFVATPKIPKGVIYGTVTDLATGERVSGVSVFTNYGHTAETDQAGQYRIDDSFAEVGFDISAEKHGYNTGVVTDTIITLPDSLRIDFALLHPEIAVSQDRFQTSLDQEGDQSFDFSITNNGNGPLEWSISRCLPNNAHIAPWQRRESIPIGEITHSSRIQGVVFAEDKFVVSVGKTLADDPNMIYILDRDFAFVESFPQFGASRLGMYDLAYDGELVWGADNRTLYGFTVQGELKEVLDVPIDYVRGLEWDNINKVLLISGRIATSPFLAMDREGLVVQNFGAVRFHKAGIACWSSDPDGYTTYFLHDREGIMTVHKENPETRDTLFVTELKPPEGGSQEGVFITDKYDVYSWVLMYAINGLVPEQRYGDRIDIMQLSSKFDWFKVFHADNPNIIARTGVIPAGESHDFVLSLNSAELKPEQYIGEVVISHNAIGGEQILDVELRVIGDEPPEPFGLVHPEDKAVLNTNDSTQIAFQWEPSSDLNVNDTIKYLFYLSTQDSTAEIAILDSTIFLIDFAEFAWEQFLLPPPVDSLTEFKWWVVVRSGADTVSCNAPRSFTYVRKWEGVSDQPIPVVFGLSAIYPSPFNSVTTIRYGADRAEQMSIRVFDVNGRLVTTLTDSPVKIGTHSLMWNASGVSSGVYVIRLESGGRVRTAKTVLVK